MNEYCYFITALGSNESYQNRNHIITNTVFSYLKKIEKKKKQKQQQQQQKQQENKRKHRIHFFSH